MRYTVIVNRDVFYTNWFDAENNFVHGMIVIDNINHEFTFDGINWNEITEDHL